MSGFPVVIREHGDTVWHLPGPPLSTGRMTRLCDDRIVERFTLQSRHTTPGPEKCTACLLIAYFDT